MMKEELIRVPCKNCGTKVPINDLRRNDKGLWVCSNCLIHKYVLMEDIPNVMPQKIPIKSREEIKPVVKKEEKIPYYCTNCKFSFTRARGSPSKGCPYCGKEHSVQRKESAADILREVDSMF